MQTDQKCPLHEIFLGGTTKILKYVLQNINPLPSSDNLICLALQAKSAATYNEIRYDEKSGTGFVELPSQRRLQDYINYIHPKQGCNHEILNELKNKIKEFRDIERFLMKLKFKRI